MTFTYIIRATFFFIGFLYGMGFIQNALSLNTKIYSQSNSAHWQGKSPFKKFWHLNSENDDESGEALLFQLLKLLTKENAAYKRIEYTDILAAAGKLDFKITETPDTTSSIVTLNIVLNTSAENQNSKNNAAGKTVSSPAKNRNGSIKEKNAANSNHQPSKFDEMILERHNVYRKKHKAPPLVYSKQISEVSQEWANKLAEKSEFKHRPNNRYGENLYVYWHSDPNHQMSPYAAADAWYDEVKNYTYSNSPNITIVGHFTQMVWKNSKELGIGVVRTKNNSYIVVCNYSPPGNYAGQYVKNVLRPSKA